MNLKKLIVSMCLAVPCLFQASAHAQSLKIASDCTYPPFGFRDSSGELKGFDVDIAREIGKRMNRPVEIVCQAWDGMIPGLLAQKFDLISASMSITEERKKSISFSLPYRSSSARFVGLKTLNVAPFQSDGSANPKALAGKSIGIQRASVYENYLKDKFPGSSLVQYDTVDNMLLDLKSGRIDLVFAGPIKLENDFLSKPENSGFGFTGEEVDDISYFGPGIGVGIRKDDEALLKEVNTALEGMFSDGTFKTINLKYWNFSVLPSVWKE